MTVESSTSFDLELAHAFARAYREVDEDELRGLIAPDALVRILMPRGYQELEGPEGIIDQLRGFFAKWPVEELDQLEVELLRPNLMQTGRMAQVEHRFRLRQAEGGQAATVVITHLIAITNGRIAVLDELCTGVMPDPA